MESEKETILENLYNNYKNFMNFYIPIAGTFPEFAQNLLDGWEESHPYEDVVEYSNSLFNVSLCEFDNTKRINYTSCNGKKTYIMELYVDDIINEIILIHSDLIIAWQDGRTNDRFDFRDDGVLVINMKNYPKFLKTIASLSKIQKLGAFIIDHKKYKEKMIENIRETL